MDPTTLAGGITAVSSLLGALKTVTGIAKDVNNVELNRQISEVQMRVFDVQEKLMRLQEENMRLREENRHLNAAAELRRHVVFHDHANWEKQEDGSEDGPFCSSCWADGKLHRPQINSVERGEVCFVCREHKTDYRFRVPEPLVKNGDLSSYKQSGVSHPAQDSYGPDGWMR